MDGSGSSCRLVASVNGPRARLFFTSRQKCAQAKQVINGPNKCVHAGVFHTQTAEVIQRLLLTQINQFTLQLRADDDCFRSEMVPRVLLNRRDVLRRAVAGDRDLGGREVSCPIIAVGAGGYSRQIRFGDVTGEDRRL